MASLTWVLSVLCLATLASCASVSVNVNQICAEAPPRTNFQYKNLNGAPTDFSAMELPADSAATTYTSHTVEKLTFPTAMAGASVEQDLFIDDDTGFVLGVFVNGKASFSLTSPTGKNVPLTPKNTSIPIGDSFQKLVGTEFDLVNVSAGIYKFTVTLVEVGNLVERRNERAIRKPKADAVDGYVVYGTESDVVLSAHVQNDARHITNAQIGVNAKIVDRSAHPLKETLAKGFVPALGTVKILDAEMDVEFPDGHVETAEMHDDGLHNDGAANDGEYGASLKASESGTYEMRALFKGVDSNGNTFKREFEQSQKIVPSAVSLNGKAFAYVKEAGSSKRLMLSLGLKESSPCSGNNIVFRPYAEVWGKDANGKDIAVAFTTNLALVKRFLTVTYVEMEVDLKWAAAANAKGPFTLRNVLVEDNDANAPMDVTASIPVFMFSSSESMTSANEASTSNGLSELEVSLEQVASSFDGVITKEMREGVAPELKGSVDGKVLVVHGYCADKNPFEVQPDDWENAVFYSAAREGNPLSAENNAFAENVLNFAEKVGLSSFSYVGQSQGGMVGTHIKNFYHTGLDAVEGDRVVQTLATPFLGNSALSKLGGVIDVIAPDCTGPYDLTREGALAWQAGIAPATYDNFYFYNTVYEKGLLGGGWCQLLMNSFLELPNDGVTELEFAAPPGTGATFCGTAKGQCHTEDMNWEPSFWDSGRNSMMSRCAGRTNGPLSPASSCQC